MDIRDPKKGRSPGGERPDVMDQRIFSNSSIE